MKLINIKKYAAILILLVTGTMAASVNAQTCSGSNISVDSSQNCPSVDVGSDINSITNAGTIGSGNFGIDLVGSVSPSNITVGTITNMATGAIGSGYYGILIASNASGANQSIILTINAINNAGSISGSAYAILSDAALGCPPCNNSTSSVSIKSITNMATGVISAINYGIYNVASVSGIRGYEGVSSTATIGSIVNSGVISADSAIANDGNDVSGTNTVLATIGTIQNSGSITGVAYGIRNTGQINGISNTGSISAGTSNPQQGINNSGTIGTLVNSGSGLINAYIGIQNGGTINTLTNAASITGNDYGIVNYGTITTLNNGQGAGNLNGALTLFQNLPTNYNIIINSKSNYGQLTVNGPDGTMNFGIYAGSLIASRIYTGVLQGLSDINVGATRTGTYDGMNWTLAISSGTSWDLTFTGASLVGTQTSVHNSAQRLRSVFNQSIVSSNFANMNTYDCNLFDSKGMCISAGGRYTTVDNPSANSSSAVVVVGYKATPNIRIGGFLDQNVSNNTPNGIKVSNKNPLMGIFAVWNQNADGLGVQVKLANAYQDKDVNTTRDVIGTSEAGTGATNLNTQSYVGELSYAFLTNQDKTTLRPYLALRQTTIKQDAYTETGVSTPLSYGSLKDRSTTALVGLKLNHALTPKATLTASLGIEQDLEHSVDQYSATSASISGLTSENFNDSIKRTRPVASAGAYYTVSKSQRISGDVYYQQLPFQSTGSTTAYVSYMIGL